MDIYAFMNQKMTARINGEETGMFFPSIAEISKYWEKFGLRHKGIRQLKSSNLLEKSYSETLDDEEFDADEEYGNSGGW